MTVARLDDVALTLGKSGLIAEDQLQRFLEQSPSPAGGSAALLDALVAAGLLTDWQRDRLLAGKHRGFFLGKYKLLSQLGSGGMGRVYLAEHRLMRHRVAIKTMANRMLGNDAYLQRFQQEARAAAAVDHPRVVRAFDFDVEGDVYFLVMEYVNGEDLHKIIERDGILPIPIAAECIRQTAEGLEAIHQTGMIHRDIKPSNLLVDSQGNVRILDLGLARLTAEDVPSLTLMNDDKMIGTVDYLSPEQARNSHRIDLRADLYSLGCTFYFLLSGRPPFADGTVTERLLDHQNKPPTDIRRLRPEVPPELTLLCHRLLAKKPGDRPQSGAEVVAALGDWLLRYDAAVRGGVLPAAEPPAPLPATASAASRQRPAEDDLRLAEDDDTTPNVTAGQLTAHSLPASSARMLAPCAPLELAEDADSRQAAAPDEIAGSESAANGNVAEPQIAPASHGESNLLDELPPLSSDASPLDFPDLLSAAESSAPALQPVGEPLVARATPNSVPDQASAPESWNTKVSRLVRRQTEEGFTYSLWFLIAAGVFLAALVFVVAYSYVQSTRAPEVIKGRNTEGGNR